MQNIPVEAVFEPEMKWRLIEEYGADSFCEQEDGKLLFRFGFHDPENLLTWLFSFGDKVELLEPYEFREEIAGLAKKIKEKYERDI